VKTQFPTAGIKRREVNGKIRTYITDLPFTLDPLPLDGIEKSITIFYKVRQQGNKIFVLGEGSTVTLAGLFARELARDSSPGDPLIFRVRNSRQRDHEQIIRNGDQKYQEITMLEFPDFVRQGDVLVGIAAEGDNPGIIRAVNQAKKVHAKTILLTGMAQNQFEVKVDVQINLSGDTLEQVEDGLLILQFLMSKGLRENWEMHKPTENINESATNRTEIQEDPVQENDDIGNYKFASLTASNLSKVIFDNLNELYSEKSFEILPDHNLRKGLEKTLQIFDASSGSLVLFDEKGRMSHTAIAFEGKVNLYPPEHLIDILQRGLTGWVSVNCQPALVVDTSHDPRWLRRSWDYSQGLRSAISSPIMEKDRVIGVLTLVRQRPKRFQDMDLALLVAIVANPAFLSRVGVDQYPLVTSPVPMV
jgi:D-sedoheptulose 7-phosphate isomerase